MLPSSARVAWNDINIEVKTRTPLRRIMQGRERILMAGSELYHVAAALFVVPKPEEACNFGCRFIPGKDRFGDIFWAYPPGSPMEKQVIMSVTE